MLLHVIPGDIPLTHARHCESVSVACVIAGELTGTPSEMYVCKFDVPASIE